MGAKIPLLDSGALGWEVTDNAELLYRVIFRVQAGRVRAASMHRQLVVTTSGIPCKGMTT